MRNSIFPISLSLLFLTSCDVEKPFKTARAKSQNCSLESANKGIRRIASADLKVGTGHSTAVISNAQKFIIPVPPLGRTGEPLVYPQSYQKAGQQILDYTGKPVGDRGLVFFNGKDKSWQAVKGDGAGVIIINEVTQAQANQLYRKIRELKPGPNNLTLDELKQVLTFAQERLGLVDMYNSSRAFVQEKMTPVAGAEIPKVSGAAIKAYGFLKRDDRDVNQAIYIPGEFVFEGPAASPQEFENGGVIVEQDGKMRGVQPDIFVRTYRLSDGRAISSAAADLAAQCN